MLARLGRAQARRIPVVQQLSVAECGAACLAMTLGYHGRHVPLDELREALGVGRDGASALALLDGARHYGLRGRGVRLEVDDLEYLDPGSILHWSFNHFVVFERVLEGAIEIVDPGFGRRRVSLEEVRREFTGVALLFEPGEDFTPGARADRPLVRYARQILGQHGQWSRILVTSLALQGFALAIPILTGAVVDRVVPRADRHLLAVLGIGAGALVAFHFLTTLVRAHLLLQLRTQLDARMTLGFLEHLVGLPYAFFQRRSAGDLMMRLGSNATIREILTGGALSGLLDGVLVSIYLIVLLAASPALGGVVLGLGFLQVLVFLLTRRRTRDLMGQGLAVQARSESYQVELLAGMESLKAMGAEPRAVEHWSGLFVDTLNVALERGRLQAWVEALTGTLRLASPLVVLLVGAGMVLGGSLSLGTMLALGALAVGFLTPLADLVGTASQLQLLGSYVERLDDVLRAEPEQDRARVHRAPAITGRIELDRVSFRYGPLAPPAVQGVSLCIEPGQLVAVVGRSGSGKSTLASLLVGLYRPTEGRVAFDDHDLAELELSSLRSQLGIVTQRPYLFGASVRANIALADPSQPLERVVEAARLAQIHDDIAAMGMGYETVLSDGGASLSGGQRQRLALARALVRRPAVLVLDEATSALDAIAERQVQHSLASLRCTRVVIAHRLSTIRDADVILVMDGGRLVEQGTHDVLLRQEGAYAALVAAQMPRSEDSRRGGVVG